MSFAKFSLTFLTGLFVLSFAILSAQDVCAQTPEFRLFGVTITNGGGYGNGTIFSVDPNGSNFSTLKIFQSNPNGSNPFGGLLQMSSGEIFGTTTLGGEFEAGVIFKFNSDGTGYTVIHNFDKVNGAVPTGALAEGDDNYLYGSTIGGGINDTGIIYKIKSDGSSFTKLYDFVVDEFATGGIMSVPGVGLFGMAQTGGANGMGFIYKINPDGSGFSKLFDFDGLNTGSSPSGSLLLGSDGDLYGMLPGGGSDGLGVVFKIKTNGTGFVKLFDFNGAGGSGGNLVQNGGDLFGVNTDGVFKIGMNGTAYTQIFNDIQIGTPFPNIMRGANGKLFLTTPSGGSTYHEGVIFNINTDGTNLSIAHDFDDGSSGDFGYILQATSGDFFGVTGHGGPGNRGRVYRLKDDGTYNYVKDFSLPDGAIPQGSLVKASDGKLYGMTREGGSNGSGVIYNLNKNGSDFTILHNLAKTRDPFQGQYEISNSLMQASDEDLYGVFPGSANMQFPGEIFTIKTNGSYTKLFEFDEINTGSTTTSKLIQGGDGALYGIALSGGLYGRGTIFKIQPDGTGFLKIFDFDQNAFGGVYDNSLFQGADGFLYGTTYYGGANNQGVIFKIKTDGSDFIKLRDFHGPTVGSRPNGSLIQLADGYLYGTNFGGGGLDSYGTIYKLKPDGSDFLIIHHFDIINGGAPVGTLVSAPDGYLYGLTRSSEFNTGVIYRIKPDGTDYSRTFEFSEETGIKPIGDLLVINKESQTISFNNITTPKKFGDPDFSLTATSSSGLPVSFTSSNSSVATITGNTVTILGTGTTTITATQTGNNDFSSAADVEQTLTIGKAEQIITFNSLATKAFGEAPFTLSAATTSGLAISYTSSDETVATISGSTVTIVGAGSANITAKQAGNSNYAAAPDVSQTLAVSKANQTITFNSLTTKTFGELTFALSATNSSSLPVLYLSSDETVATISGSTITIVGAGTTTITAKQAGNTNYNAATDVEQTLTVNKADQTITFSAISTKTFGDVPFNLTGTSSSGLALQYSTTSDKVSLSGSQVTLNNPGSVTINADQTGNGNYKSATTVPQTFCINPAKPTITTTGLNSGTPVLTSSSSSGNQWYKNGVLVADAVSNTFSPKSDGSYTVKVTIDNCSSELSAEQILVITGDIASSSVSSFLVYPNPVKDNLSISLASFEPNLQVEIVIYDMSGKVMDKLIKQGEKATIPVTSYSVGTYFVKASQRTQIQVAKFAKE